MPDLMRPQIGRIRSLVPLLGVQSLGVPDTEADDLMAAYACEAVRQGWGVVLATNDKDLFQLVADGIKIYSTNKTDLASPKDAFALLGADQVLEKWGVNPEQIGDVLCLVGDSVDNIAGVPGMGLKRAVALINELGSIEAVLANVGAIKNESIRQKISAAVDVIRCNQEMIRLETDLPLPTALEELTIRPRYEALVEELQRYEFKSLTQEIRDEAAFHALPKATPPMAQGELF